MNMKRVVVYALSYVCIAFGVSPTVSAESFGLVSSNLVHHPVTLPSSVRSAAIWSGRTGAWGKIFAEQTLRLHGFHEFYEFNSGSDGGMVLVAVKRGVDGSLIDIKFLEVTTGREVTPKLGQTRYGGRQMSKRWLTTNLLNMSRNGNATMRALALDISRFQRKSGQSIESFGEVIHVNSRTGTVTGYMVGGKAVVYSESVERLLKNIQRLASSTSDQKWATCAVGMVWEKTGPIQMLSWLGKAVNQQSKATILETSGSLNNGLRRGLLNQSRRAALTRTFVRAAGPLAVLVVFAIEAKEMADVELAYHRGQISLRQRNISHASKVGGLSGMIAGGWAGAWVGAFGGPFAEVTVPAGFVIGGAIGYIAGSAVGGYTATTWYNLIDTKVRDRFEKEWLSLHPLDFREAGLP